MVKVTKKVNFDSLWVKATTAEKTWFKLSVTRSGISSKHTMSKETSTVFETIVRAEFNKYKEEKLNYGQLIDNVEYEFNLIK